MRSQRLATFLPRPRAGASLRALSTGKGEASGEAARWGPIKFTGKEEDIEVGLTYFGFRYYQPYLGRWASADPLTIHGLGADLNPYAYVGGRVMSDVDPFGLDSCGADDAKTVKCSDGSTWTREGTTPEGGAIYNIEDPAPASPAAGGPERGWSREMDHAIDAAERLATTPHGVGGGYTFTPTEYWKGVLNESADHLESTGTLLSPQGALITWALSGGRAAPRARMSMSGGPNDVSQNAARVAVIVGSIALGQAGGGAGGGGRAVRWVDPRTLRPTHGGLTRNVIDKLVRSMRKGGYDLAEPIEAFEIEGSLYIRDGHHRAVAAARAGLSQVPVLVSQPSSEAAAEAIVRDFIRTLSDSGIRGP